MTSEHRQLWTDASGMHSVRPVLPYALVGREAALDRVATGLERLPVVVVYGLAGVGKSAFAVEVVKRWGGRVLYANARAGALEPVLDDVRRRLAESPRSSVDSLRARLRDLTRLLDEEGALLLLDDVHLLEPTERLALVDRLGRRLQRGRVLLTSRERIDVDPAGPDRLEITLDSLPESAARELWSELDALYGEVPGFEEAFARVGGTPFTLRRAHRGGPVGQADVSPMAETLDALSEDERFVGLALALARMPLPSDAVNELLPDGRAIRALLTLRRRLVVDIDGAARCTMHDLFREALLDGARSESLVVVHRALAPTLRETPADPVVRCREEVYHWRAAGEAERAAEVLQTHASVLARAGASSELLTAIQALPRAQRLGPLLAIEGRCLMRLGRPEAAHRLLSEGGGEDQGLVLTRAQAALLTARLSEAEAHLDAVYGGDGLTTALRERADRLRVTLWSVQGQEEPLWVLLDRLEARAATDAERCGVLYQRTFAHWVANQYPEADLALQQARALLAERRQTSATWRLYITFAALDAILGRTEAAEAVLRETSGGQMDAAETSPLSHPVERAILLSEQGNRAGAAALLRDTVEEYRRIGLRLAEWWARLVLGRNLLLLGRLREGRAQLDDVVSQASAAGAGAIARSAARERAWDPLPAVEVETSEATLLEPHPSTRAHRLAGACLQMMRARRWDEADAELARLEPLVSSLPGTGYDRPLVEVAQALLARREGDETLFQAALGRAREAALEDAADDDFVDAAVAWVLEDERPARPASSVEMSRSGTAVAVYDARRHELRVGERTLSLARRHVQRKLLVMLAEHAEQVVTKERLVSAVWEVEYHPLRHDNTLRVNVLRLRSLLEDTPITLETEETGYRLCCPGGIRVVT